MRDLAALKKRVRDDWEHPERVLRLLDAVTALPDDAQRYLTLPILKELGKLGSLRETNELAEYLAGDHVAFFDTHYLLITGDDTTRELEDQTVYEALNAGGLVDPVTGEEVSDWETKVIQFYEVRGDADE